MNSIQELPIICSIGGLDPSGGAGILADIKTFENHNFIGFGVSTCITFQTEDRFLGVEWLPFETIKAQLEPLLNNYSIPSFKIGMVENLVVLKQIIEFIKLKSFESKIYWDPIIKTSSGYIIHDDLKAEALIEVLNQIYLVTPNFKEYQILNEFIQKEYPLKNIHFFCNTIVTGNEIENDQMNVFDYFFNKNPTENLEPSYIVENKKLKMEKHGSGCTYSSSLACNMYDFPIEISMKNASKYVAEYLKSDPSKLGLGQRIAHIPKNSRPKNL